MLFETTPSSALPPEGGQSSFPIRLEVEYPQRLSRLSTFFRLVLAIPVFITVVYLMQAKRRAAVTPMNQDAQEQDRVR